MTATLDPTRQIFWLHTMYGSDDQKAVAYRYFAAKADEPRWVRRAANRWLQSKEVA